MATVRYVGMFESVEIGETGQWAYRGKALEVPDDVARRLVLAEDWDGDINAVPADDRTYEELYVRAQELEIEGRSTMDKSELITAVREHEEG